MGSAESKGLRRGQRGPLHFPVPRAVWPQQATTTAVSEALTAQYGRGYSPTDECFSFVDEKSTDVARGGPSLRRQGGWGVVRWVYDMKRPCMKGVSVETGCGADALLSFNALVPWRGAAMRQGDLELTEML